MEQHIKTLLDEYAGCYRAVDNCSDSIGGVEDCHICKEDKERMQEIEKELETSIRKEVMEEIVKLQEEVYEDLIGEYQAIPIGSLRSYALSKGIDIK